MINNDMNLLQGKLLSYERVNLRTTVARPLKPALLGLIIVFKRRQSRRLSAVAELSGCVM